MRLLISAACACTVLAANAASAAVNQADLEIIARALTFMNTPSEGKIRLGIVYVANDAVSVRDATDVAAMIGAGLTVGNVTLTPVLVRLDQMMDAPVDLFLMPVGLGDRAGEVAAATDRKKIPCVTLDIAQVQDGTCVLGVSVQPKVQIYLNRQAAAKSGTSFAPVFRMMITEF